MPPMGGNLLAESQTFRPDHQLEALRSLEWKRFELLCARYYEAVGFKMEILDAGQDGGIDIKLFKIDPSMRRDLIEI